MTLNVLGLFGRKPLLAGIAVVADEFFLFGVHRNHGKTLRQAFFDRCIDVLELRIAIRVVCALLGLPIALQAIVKTVKNLSDLRMADPVVVSAKLPGNRPRAFTNPSQGRLRIASRLAINHLLQVLQEARVGNSQGLASCTGASDAARRWHDPLLNFADSLGDGSSRHPACAMHHRDSSKAQAHGFIGSHNPARALVQKRPHRTKLLCQLGPGAHAQRVYAYRS